MTKAGNLIKTLDEMAQTGRVSGVATKVKKSGDDITVKYHDTDVVKATKTKIILDTGGWFTNTTKTRMNQASNEYGLGYNVYQKGGKWFVDYYGETIPFAGKKTLTLKRN
jgi:hypothetical protein